MPGRAVVTGATGGLGFETAAALARAGAHVVLAGRDAAKGEAALARLRREVPGTSVEFEMLDLASLASVQAFAGRMQDAGQVIDTLVNNAGIMAPSVRRTTADGFELQFGVNYLGHFALTAWLMPALLRAEAGARVVQVSSVAHRRGRMAWDDLQGDRRYNAWTAYSQSKLAMLIFALELARRAKAQGWPLVSVAAHPGWAATDLIANGPGGGGPSLKGRVLDAGFRLFAQSAADGALPLIHAAAAPDAQAGGYYGPTGLGEIRGPPGPARVMPQARDSEAGKRLWTVSETLARVGFPN